MFCGNERYATVQVHGSELQPGDLIARHGYVWRIVEKRFETHAPRFYVRVRWSGIGQEPPDFYRNSIWGTALRADLPWTKVVRWEE